MQHPIFTALFPRASRSGEPRRLGDAQWLGMAALPEPGEHLVAAASGAGPPSDRVWVATTRHLVLTDASPGHWFLHRVDYGRVDAFGIDFQRRDAAIIVVVAGSRHVLPGVPDGMGAEFIRALEQGTGRRRSRLGSTPLVAGRD